MTCQEVRSYLEAYLDRELPIKETLDVDAHLTFCMQCQWICAKERELRALLRTRVPREPAPSALQARVRDGIRRLDRRSRWRPVWLGLRWAPAPLALVAALLLALNMGNWPQAAKPDPARVLIDELVRKHVTYSRVEAPAEVASSDRAQLAGWFRDRVSFDVPVPDFSPSGIRLLGGRLSDLGDRPVAYLFYEKGRQLVSLYAFPRRGLPLPETGWTELEGDRYLLTQYRGHEVVLWGRGETLFALVSQLSQEDLLDCALTVSRLLTRT